MTLQSDAVFEMIQSRVKEQPAKAKSVNAVFLFNITKDGKQAKQWSKYIIGVLIRKELHIERNYFQQWI